MSETFPHADQAFNDLMAQLTAYIAAHAAQLGIPTATATSLTGEYSAWTDDYADHKTKTADALAATAAKNTRKQDFMDMIRPVIQTIQNNPAVTDEMRQQMGLPILDPNGTRAVIPATKPMVQVETPEHLRHLLRWRDETTPKTKAKPAGVRGAEIWLWIGPNPPADLAQFKWMALDSATPYLMAHEAANAGKTAYYALRWQNTRGEPGPWSDVASATILG